MFEVVSFVYIKYDLISVGGDKMKFKFCFVNVDFVNLNLLFIDVMFGFGFVYGLVFVYIMICLVVKMMVLNSKGWVVNVVVEFFFYGMSIFFDVYVVYGVWKKVSDGVVSVDGMMVFMNDGEGIFVFGLIGFCLKL